MTSSNVRLVQKKITQPPVFCVHSPSNTRQPQQPAGLTMRQILKHAIPGMDGGLLHEVLNERTTKIRRQRVQVASITQVLHSGFVSWMPAPLMMKASSITSRLGQARELPERGGMIGKTFSMKINRILDDTCLMRQQGHYRSTSFHKHSRKFVQSVVARAEMVGMRELDFHKTLKNPFPSRPKRHRGTHKRAGRRGGVNLHLGLIRRVHI